MVSPSLRLGSKSFAPASLLENELFAALLFIFLLLRPFTTALILQPQHNMSNTSSTITLTDTSSTPKLASQQTQGLDAKDSASTSSQQQQQLPPHTPQARRFTLEDRDFLDNISKTLRSLDDELQSWRRRVDERDYRPRTAREAELDARFQAGWQAGEEAWAIREASEARRWQAEEIERDVLLAQISARSAAVMARWSPEAKQRAAAIDAADDEAVRVALEAAGLGSEVRRGGGSGGAGSSVHGQGQRQAGA